MTEAARRLHILVTGTPGVGKSTVAQRLAAALEMSYVNVGEVISERRLYDELDSERECTIYDDDAVFEFLEGYLAEHARAAIDFHSTSAMALGRWFDLILVLHANTEVLWDRLEARAYSRSKIEENVECEIMRVCEEEVLEYFDGEELDVFEDVREFFENPQRTTPSMISAPNNSAADLEDLLAALVQGFNEKPANRGSPRELS